MTVEALVAVVVVEYPLLQRQRVVFGLMVVVELQDIQVTVEEDLVLSMMGNMLLR
jgi:hypothetical protein